MNTIFPIEFRNILRNKLLKSADKKYIRIKVDGKFVKVKGHVIWESMKAARASLTHQFRYSYSSGHTEALTDSVKKLVSNNDPYAKDYTGWKQFIDECVEIGTIEFVEID